MPDLLLYFQKIMAERGLTYKVGFTGRLQRIQLRELRSIRILNVFCRVFTGQRMSLRDGKSTARIMNQHSKKPLPTMKGAVRIRMIRWQSGWQKNTT